MKKSKLQYIKSNSKICSHNYVKYVLYMPYEKQSQLCHLKWMNSEIYRYDYGKPSQLCDIKHYEICSHNTSFPFWGRNRLSYLYYKLKKANMRLIESNNITISHVSYPECCFVGVLESFSDSVRKHGKVKTNCERYFSFRSLSVLLDWDHHLSVVYFLG